MTSARARCAACARYAVDHAGVHQDLEYVDAPPAAAAAREEPPQRRSIRRSGVRREAVIGAGIAADHEAGCVPLHDVDRQIVDGGAVDQDFVAPKHRRHDARNGDRGAQRIRHRTLAMLECPAGGQSWR